MMKSVAKIWERAARSHAGFTLAELLVVVRVAVGPSAVLLPRVGRKERWPSMDEGRCMRVGQSPKLSAT